MDRQESHGLCTSRDLRRKQQALETCKDGEPVLRPVWVTVENNMKQREKSGSRGDGSVSRLTRYRLR